MADECPVCDVVAPDGEHLAHHLAIVALTRGGDHETWLDEHAPGWTDAEPAALAETVLDHAEDVEHDLVDDAADHDHGPLDPAGAPGSGSIGARADRGSSVDAGARQGTETGAPRDDETAAIVSEARKLTRQMQDGSAADAPGSEPHADTDPDADDETDTDE